ncbi:MAG: hypothetical protein J7L07_12415 [Candidatus Odinarchaeota archaeon]|nr:hypothetical protein [Candidatus Odinarchaeota archaeon]
MSRIWKVVFEGEEPGVADDFELSFVDVRDVIGRFLGVKREAMNKITENIKNEEKYSAIGNIKEVVSPEGEELSLGGFIALLGIDKNDLKFGFLFAFIENEAMLIAIWPEPFADAIKENENILGGVIYYMVEKPDNWKRVDLILPIKE